MLIILNLRFYGFNVLFIAKMQLVWNVLPGMGITQVGDTKDSHRQTRSCLLKGCAKTQGV